MPNFDGGHYFLTALLPIGGPDIEDVAGPSPAHRVREALSVLPKARQTPSKQDCKGWPTDVGRDPVFTSDLS
jgi:hypothetical protein